MFDVYDDLILNLVEVSVVFCQKSNSLLSTDSTV